MNELGSGLINFIKLCKATKDDAVLAEILALFFTHEERLDFANRYNIISELLKGEQTQRNMAKNLNVSIAKITRGSNELKRMDEKLLEYLRKNLSS